jgi:hypothetical protein
MCIENSPGITQVLSNDISYLHQWWYYTFPSRLCQELDVNIPIKQKAGSLRLLTAPTRYYKTTLI